MSGDGESVLARKLGNPPVGRSPLSDLDLVGENFGHMLEDTLRPLLQTSIGALIMSCEIAKLADVIEGIQVPAMLCLVNIDSSDSSALINVSADLVYHIVDMRMGGDASVAPAPTTRSFTGIDVELCMDIFGSIIQSFTGAIEEHLGVPLGNALTMGGHKQDINTIRIAAKTSDVLVISVSLDIGEAARSGDFDFIVPLSVLDTLRASAQVNTQREKQTRNDFWRIQMSRSAAAAVVPLHAILHREKMPLQAAQELAVGDIIQFPVTAASRIDMVMAMGTALQASIAQGRLGAFEGAKVIKLTEPPATAFRDNLAKMIEDV